MKVPQPDYSYTFFGAKTAATFVQMCAHPIEWRLALIEFNCFRFCVSARRAFIRPLVMTCFVGRQDSREKHRLPAVCGMVVWQAAEIETIWLRHDWTPQITHPDGIVVTKAPGVLI